MADALTEYEKLVARATAANALRMCRHSLEANAKHVKLMHESISRSRELLKSTLPPDTFVGRKTHELPTSEDHEVAQSQS